MPSSSPAPGGKPPHATPITERHVTRNWLQTLLFVVYFDIGCLMVNGMQFLVFVLFYPFAATRPHYERLIAYTKQAFGQLIVSITQLFAPTRLVLSFTDHDGNPLDPEDFIIRDPKRKGPDGKGRVKQIKLPDRSVWMSNHQIYVDWLYLWSIAYFANLSNGIYIILKASLRNVPVIGWGMQFFRFIFLRRNWDADRDALGKSLAYAAERSQTRSSRAGADKKRDDAAEAAHAASSHAAPNKLLLLIFPEGTTFTERTVPRSAKFAEKMGYEKTRNVVLPRYMGLLFSLRALAADIDDLYLVDFTVGYPGVPTAGYGERYYTLRSVYMQGVPPPAIHVNIIITRVTSPADPEEVDPSTVDASRPPLGKLPPSAKASGQERYAPSEEEKTRFDAWLRARWAGKDELMESFYKEGDMVGGEFVRKEAAAAGTSAAAAAAAAPGEQSEGYQRFVEIPMELRSPVEFGDAFTWGIPAIGAAAAVKLVQSFVGLFR